MFGWPQEPTPGFEPGSSGLLCMRARGTQPSQLGHAGRLWENNLFSPFVNIIISMNDKMYF